MRGGGAFARHGSPRVLRTGDSQKTWFAWVAKETEGSGRIAPPIIGGQPEGLGQGEAGMVSRMASNVYTERARKHE